MRLSGSSRALAALFLTVPLQTSLAFFIVNRIYFLPFFIKCKKCNYRSFGSGCTACNQRATSVQPKKHHIIYLLLYYYITRLHSYTLKHACSYTRPRAHERHPGKACIGLQQGQAASRRHTEKPRHGQHRHMTGR